MQVEELFEKASLQFEENNYEAGLVCITHCIEQQPCNSSLYSNRALCFAQLGDNQSAQRDLLRALDLNYLNYVAYFNLFSLQYRSQQKQQAFDNLSCSLSCLYLLRARKSRRELDLQRAINYADNNYSAYVLKSLMYLEEGRLKPALNYIEWALDINPADTLAHKIKFAIVKKIDPYAPDDYQESTDKAKSGFRLKGSYKPVDNFEEEVRARVQEFNEMYDDLNGNFETVAQKVPRILTDNDKTHERSRFESQKSEIYEIRLRDHRGNHSAVLKLSQTKQSQSPTTREQLPEEDKKNDLILMEAHETSSVQDILNKHLLTAQEPVELQRSKEEQNLLEDSLQKEHDQHQIVVSQPKAEEVEENLLEDAPAQLNNYEQQIVELKSNLQSLGRVEEVRELASVSVSKNETSPVSKKETVSNSKMSEASSNSEPVSLYPIGNRKKIQFTIIGAEIKTPGTHKDFYLTGNYNSRKGQRIRTSIKKLDGTGCKWYAGNPPTPISEAVQTLSVKLYSKLYFAINDELIGEGEVEIIRSGEIKIPIYFKNKNTGFVSVRIDLA